MIEIITKRRGRPPKVAAIDYSAESARRGPGRPRKGEKEGISWEDAIEQVLRDGDGAMRYTDIASEISARGLKSVANPVASVASAFTRSRSDPDSRFLPMGNGLYALKEELAAQAAPPVAGGLEEKGETGALKALGMFWQREAVVWSGKPRLLGRQSEGASSVDFSEQIGVYLLHDRDRVIYVGRAADT